MELYFKLTILSETLEALIHFGYQNLNLRK